MGTFLRHSVVLMIKRSIFLVLLGRRGNLLAVLRRDVTEGSRWLCRRQT